MSEKSRLDRGRVRAAAASIGVEGSAIEPSKLLLHSPMAVAVVDAGTRLIYLNDRARRYIRSAEEILGKDIFAAFPDLAGTALEAALEAAMRGRAPVHIDRFRYAATRRTYFVWILPLEGNSGAALYFRDVTLVVRRERQQAAIAAFGIRALSARDDQHAAILDDAIETAREALAVDISGLFLLSDAGDSLVLRAGRGWIEGVRDGLAEPLSGDTHVALTARGGSPIAFNELNDAVPFSDRALLEVHGVSCGLSAVVQGAKGTHGVIVAYSRDRRHFTGDDVNFLQSVANTVAGLVQRWMAADALDKSEQMLLQAQKLEAVGRLAGGIAHDFNNLLTLINSYSEIVIAELREEDPVRADVEEIRKAALKAAALTRQLLAFSRRQVLRPRLIDINDIVESLQKLLLRVIGEDIQLEVDLGAGLGLVLADPGQLEQVLMNLVLNARDAMRDGGSVTITSRLVSVGNGAEQRWSDVAPGAYAELAVADTGHGMSPEILAHVFEPFFTTKEPGLGTGLGLSTVYGIVNQSGGHVHVTSEVGSGTTFYILLPVRDDSGAAIDPSPAVASLAAGGHETVLVVEDEPEVRRVARRVLEGHGYRVIVASNGEEALLRFREQTSRINLVMLDMVMPSMGGRECARQLLEIDPGVRILFMSGYSDEERVHHEKRKGTAFLEKPFTVRSILDSVRRLLDEPR